MRISSSFVRTSSVGGCLLVVCFFRAATGIGDEPPAAAKEADRPAPQQSATTDDWFWPDPYGHLGSANAGVGWHFLRMGADATVAKEVGLTEAERLAIADIRQTIIQLDAKRRKKGQPISRRSVIWDKAAETARRVIAPDRAARLDQLTIQRVSYNAFLRDDVIESLRLSEQQQEQISAAIAGHSERLRQKDQSNADKLNAFEQPRPAADDLVAMQRTLQIQRGVYGRASHRETWEDIRETLTESQRAEFNRLRGPRPPSMRSYLQAFPRIDEITSES